MQSATTREELGNQIQTLRDVFDVEHLSYHTLNANGEAYAATTYSTAWADEYFGCDYARLDPVVQGCLRRFHPVDWKNLDWTPKPARSFMGAAISSGVGNQGFSVPIRGPAGQFALFTASHRASDDAWKTYCDSHLEDLLLLAHFLNQRALEIELGSDMVNAKKLSPREAEALTLLAAGQSRAQAAETMSISEHTLRVYIESARLKLGAANTVHAVALALTQGLLVF
ncbi:helix-turn-helix transcriptional regulator [Oceaniglobus roseus]|uniref:helix-turn-helix transcriptional regulator n=1 Tax=Oceaniglobus roseus TaxID=1737570 RepID=UPI001FE7A69D|nr:autoinducer binding domain-containing protein [Kandeliimicrobium roseum]